MAADVLEAEVGAPGDGRLLRVIDHQGVGVGTELVYSDA